MFFKVVRYALNRPHCFLVSILFNFHSNCHRNAFGQMQLYMYTSDALNIVTVVVRQKLSQCTNLDFCAKTGYLGRKNQFETYKIEIFVF